MYAGERHTRICYYTTPSLGSRNTSPGWEANNCIKICTSHYVQNLNTHSYSSWQAPEVLWSQLNSYGPLSGAGTPWVKKLSHWALEPASHQPLSERVTTPNPAEPGAGEGHDLPPSHSHGHLELLHPLPLHVFCLAEELETLLPLKVNQVEAVGPLWGAGDTLATAMASGPGTCPRAPLPALCAHVSSPVFTHAHVCALAFLQVLYVHLCIPVCAPIPLLEQCALVRARANILTPACSRHVHCVPECSHVYMYCVCTCTRVPCLCTGTGVECMHVHPCCVHCLHMCSHVYMRPACGSCGLMYLGPCLSLWCAHLCVHTRTHAPGPTLPQDIWALLLPSPPWALSPNLLLSVWFPREPLPRALPRPCLPTFTSPGQC